MDYVGGSFKPFITESNVKFYWIKNGWLFRAGGIGFAALNIINSIIKNNFSWSNNKTALISSAAAFSAGMLLKKKYKPSLWLGKKYHIETLDLSDE